MITIKTKRIPRCSAASKYAIMAARWGKAKPAAWFPLTKVALR
jgi:hypothetical protein